MMLFGQDDPDDVVAAGLHGLGGRLLPVRISKTGWCRFTVATSATSETVDFSRITALRYSAVEDPAAVIARAIAGRGRNLSTLQLVIIDGVANAICGTQGCTEHRVFALHDAGRLGAAQAAAATFRNHACSALPATSLH